MNLSYIDTRYAAFFRFVRAVIVCLLEILFGDSPFYYMNCFGGFCWSGVCFYG